MRGPRPNGRIGGHRDDPGQSSDGTEQKRGTRSRRCYGTGGEGWGPRAARPLGEGGERNKAPGGRLGLPSWRLRGGPHLVTVLLLLLQQLGNRGHGDAGLEQGPPGCARKEEAGPPPPGRLSGATAAPPPLASLPDGGRRPWDSATIPAAPGAGKRHATCSPRAASPSRLPSILEPGKEVMRGLPSLRTTRRPLTRGLRRGAEPLTLFLRGTLRQRDHEPVPSNLLLSPSPRWRREVTYARSRERESTRFGVARASARGVGLPMGCLPMEA